MIASPLGAQDVADTANRPQIANLVLERKHLIFNLIDHYILDHIPFWAQLKSSPRFRQWCGFEETIWTRREQDRQTRQLIESLEPSRLRVLEISGKVWQDYGFKTYRSIEFPEFDLCEEFLSETFDLIIAEHVFEHVLWPYRAARNVLNMLEPGGYFLMACPFLYRLHPCPYDCTRWSDTGIKYFLAETGFDLDHIMTGSWGNRSCLKATFRHEFILFNRRLHSLRNEAEYPIVVWALARKQFVDTN